VRIIAAGVTTNGKWRHLPSRLSKEGSWNVADALVLPAPKRSQIASGGDKSPPTGRKPRVWTEIPPRTDVGAGLATTRSEMADRRAYRRIGGSAVPWLSACTARSTRANILDISDGGIRIETSVPVRPGERQLVLLTGTGTIKVVGWAERVEISRLTPAVSYRAALRFAKPVTVSALGWAPELDGPSPIEVVSSSSLPTAEDSRTVENTLECCLRGVSGVHAVRVSALVAQLPGTEPVHFAVPASSHGNKRMLQVFFTIGALPTRAELARLRQFADRASMLPDLDFVSTPRYMRVLDTGPRVAVAPR
jgi:hypothetical protein